MFQHAQEFRDPGFTFAVNFLVLVDDTDTGNGATLGLPGSHRLSELLRSDEDYLMQRVLEASAPRGSILLIEGGAWHAAGTNRSASPRRVLKLLFTRRWMMPQIDYLALAGERAAAALPPRVRRLLDVGP
jgi:ectoine hydroxylase-related dioxygenase (phytanoyl-CoA dioxygenase family)